MNDRKSKTNHIFIGMSIWKHTKSDVIHEKSVGLLKYEILHLKLKIEWITTLSFISMRKKVTKLAFITSVLFILAACKKEELSQIPIKSNPNLNYFGFTLIDTYWDDPTDKEEKINYLDEVAPFSNIADIVVVDPEIPIIDNLKAMEQNGVLAIIHSSEIFFELKSNGGDRSGAIYGLRADYKERWDTFVSVNNLTVNHPLIHSIYLGEEPYWNGIPENEFVLACDYAKLTMPELALFLVEAPYIVADMYVPLTIDYVGFDHYFLRQPSVNEQYLSEFNSVKSKMAAHQKMILILDSHWIKNNHGSAGIAKKDMDFIARDYYNIANSDTNIVGILGYFWPSGFDDKNSVGARQMPENVKAEYERIGKIITGKP